MMSFLLTILVTIVIGFVIIWIVCVRRPSHIKVNCWFCNTDTVVPYGNKNCWDCPRCEQYNGFSEDGGYNKPIPAQSDEGLYHSVVADYHQQYAPHDGNHSNNRLCNQCTRNQLLKVKQLAAFIPHNEMSYDAEVEIYKHHLEQVYRLCGYCELVVHDELRQQNHWIKSRLLGSRLKESSEKSLPLIVFKAEMLSTRFVAVLRLVSLCCAIICCLGNISHQGNVEPIISSFDGAVMWMLSNAISDYMWLAICCGMLSSLVAILMNGKEKLAGRDVLCTFMWLLSLGLCTEAVFVHFEWLPSRSKALCEIFVSVCCVFICVYCLFDGRSRKTARFMKKSRRSYDSLSNMSSLSCDSSPVSSLADEQESVITQENVFMSSSSPKTVDLSHRATPSLRSFASTSQKNLNCSYFETMSVRSQPVYNNRAGLDNTLDAMSLGPPTNRKKQDPGMWSAYASQFNSKVSHSVSLPTLQKQKPLISPARLNLSSISRETKQIPTQDSKISTSKQLFPSCVEEQSTFSDAASQNSNHSSASSNVMSSSKDTGFDHSKGGGCGSVLRLYVLVISIIMNFALVLYLFSDKIKECCLLY
ncbi:transmembrane protein 201-like [Ptychodera flava]|uniref:transmembrane protein 201-like n=1 Tax=Ptychodera flava TaxID=63121 RepID=UPI003969F382